MTGYSATAWVNGTNPAINAANLNKIEQGLENALGFDSVSDLSSEGAPTSVLTAVTRGHTTCGDGGYGVWYWDASDMSTEVSADTLKGLYVAPSSDLTGASGAWVRMFSGAIDVAWYGLDYAKGSDSTAAINAALSARSEGDVYMPPGNFDVQGIVSVPATVNLIGGGLRATYFHLSTAGAVIKFSDATTESRGGKSGNFSIDGGDSTPTYTAINGLYIGKCVERQFESIQVRYCNGDGISIDAAQNCTFVNINSARNVNGLVLDVGAGNNNFYNFEIDSNRTYGIVFQETLGTGPFTQPENNRFWGGRVERFGTASAACLYHTHGRNNQFYGTNFSDKTITYAHDLIKVTRTASTQSVLLTFVNPFFGGDNRRCLIFRGPAAARKRRCD